MNLHQSCPALKALLVFTAILIFGGTYLSCGNKDGDTPQAKEAMSSMLLKEVLKQTTPELMSISGVEGTALGLCNGSLCIKVFVNRKEPQLDQKIHSILKEYPYEILQTGKIKALPDE